LRVPLLRQRNKAYREKNKYMEEAMIPVPQPEHGHESSALSPTSASDTRTQQVLHQTSGGNVDKIRDILFGAQMRDYETRFQRLEETVLNETAEIRETSRRRYEQLEGYVRREFEALQSRLRSERDERTEANDQRIREMKELGESINRRLRDLDDRGTQVERDLREQLLQQAKDLTDEIRDRHDSMSSLIERRFHELRHGKTDRAALATLFSELALRLNDEFQIPGADA